MSVKLSERLSATASLIRGGGIVADIGTDHGYLPIYLIENNIIPRAIAADIGKMPLENAHTSVAEAGLSDKISLRLSDGLNSFSPEDAVEFVFAGMGGTLIAEKLKEISWIKNSKYHFVFQPQSRAEELREFLYNNGFEIEKEVATHEGRRYYIAFSAVYTGINTPYNDSLCFLGKLPRTEDAKIHIEHQLTRLNKKYEANVLNAEEQKRLLKLINDLKDFIKNED